MKKLTILLTAFCVIIAVGCQNKVTANATAEQLYAMKSITEAGGTPDSASQSVSDFLSKSEYLGAYYTAHGNAGYKVKNGKLYIVGAVNSDRQDWEEIANSMSVDASVKKLELTTDEGTVKILTFDGYGYYSYEAGEEEIPTYYSKYDYAENYAGYWVIGKKNGVDEEYVEIFENGAINGRYNYKNGWSYGYITIESQLKGNTLTFKGADAGSEAHSFKGCKMVFADKNNATFYKADGTSVSINKKQ